MNRPDPIEYAERLYAAIRDANFSTISFLAFGNAVKDGVDLRRMPRIAAEPFMRVVGEMLQFDEVVGDAECLDDATVVIPEASHDMSISAPEHAPEGKPASDVSLEQAHQQDPSSQANEPEHLT
jgi:hypothetical protein